MSDYTTNFPPQTYSSSFYINSLVEDEKASLVTKSGLTSGEPATSSTLLDCFISTMILIPTPLQKLAFLTIFFHFVQTQQTRECILTDSKTVSFSSLEAYQGSKSSFNPRHPTYQGNNVNFTFKTIDRLLRNSFISFDSDSIIKIDLSNKQIRTMDDGAFNQLFCLHFLVLRGNNISTLSEFVFEGLENLRQLDLSGNQLERLDSLAFLHLTRLQVLDLSTNQITFMTSAAFTNLGNLSQLDLSRNRIKEIPPKMFSPFGSLRQLDLSSNQLKEIDMQKWTGIENLQALNLASNLLNTFDTWGNFSFSNLERLNLSGNYLRSLDVSHLRRNFPRLKTLDISENDWLCETVEVLRHYLVDSKVALGAVNCTASGTYKPSSTSTTVAPSTTTSAATTTRSREYSRELFVQNSEILMENKKVLVSVQHLQNLMVLLFVVVVVFVLVEMAVRIGLCRNLYRRMTGRTHGYLDGTSTEHMVLMGN